jgi:predicted ATP-dependent protease
MTATRLAAEALARRCDPDGLDDPAAPAPSAAAPIVGQDRAHRAVAFGIAMARPGWHLFVSGPPGTGRRSLARQAIARHAAQHGVRRGDWVYVHNFDRPHQPVAIGLPTGRGAALRDEMRVLVDELRATIPAAFESEEYAAELERLNADFKERAERGLAEIGREAQRRGLVMLRTPAGFTFAPHKDGGVMAPADFAALPQPERDRLEQAMSELQDRLLHALRDSMRLRKDHVDRLRALNRAMTKLAVDHAVDEAAGRWSGEPAVLAHLEAVRAAVIENADAFRAHEEGEAQSPGPGGGDLAVYEVNLVVDGRGADDAAIVEADLPTYQNLVGRIDHLAQFGMLLTDFRHVKAGLLHRANGGWLLVDALKLLSQPFAWTALKRALLRHEIRIEPTAELFGLAVSTIQLEPQPIPLAVKVVLFGDREICELLQRHDPEFGELFRVVADLDDDLPRDADTQRALARTLASQMRETGLLTPTRAALARVIDHGARRCGDARRVSAEVRELLDVLTEADHRARTAGRDAVDADDVGQAIAERRDRARRIDERLRDATLRELLAIPTAGAVVGQVNGLAAYMVAGETFGAPSRITATVRVGEGHVVDIQRETSLGGPIHAKGVLILSSFLAARFSRRRPHSIAASLVFEQTYGLVEGDSASLAELLALMSSIGGLPLAQSLAVTGSVDQFGTVQAVGAVDEKVEGFFDLCVARGLDGTHGVLVPASNAPQLMLRDDVVAAVRAGRFALHSVGTVDDAIGLLAGLPPGDAADPREDTANGRIALRLREYWSMRQGDGAAAARPARRGHRPVRPAEE